MKLTDFLNIHANIDFLDVDVDSDTKMFFDPYLILTDNSPESDKFKILIESFFTKVTSDYYNQKEISHLFEHFHEIKENRLGMSSFGSIQGNGTGSVLSDELETEIEKYLTLYPHSFTTFDELSIFVKGISNDRISDMTTAICLKELIEFTKKQLLKHHINIPFAKRKFYFWDNQLEKWCYQDFDLPLINGDCLILIPKKYCSTKVRLGSFQDFVNIGILGYIKNNYDSFNIPPIYKQNVKGDFIECSPTKKSIVEHYANNGINVFNPNQINQIINKENLINVINHYNKTRDYLSKQHCKG